VSLDDYSTLVGSFMRQADVNRVVGMVKVYSYSFYLSHAMIYFT